ncbi:hypothetical protein CI238_07172 [Colletotrichum incanum]|uniref:Uncharacterized protein n=1 Tax=Colletotrichum incanum TaxID=1573173 RepID=A0A167E0V3_COLIC|nr:hypothetical protein CI238_07172 [Colletotrichum incanum]
MQASHNIKTIPMKPTLITFLLFNFILLFQGISAAWHIPSLQLPLTSSRRSSSSPSPTQKIPQFITNTNHPWLSTHANKLSNLEDPKSVLCTPLDELNGLDVPEDLFRSLDFADGCCGINWFSARQRLLEMRSCPRALAEVRELKVGMSTHLGRSAFPPEDLPGLFAEVLESMTGLQQIDWRISEVDESKIFEAAFAERETELASVEELTVNTYSSWLLKAAPSLRVLKHTREESSRRSGPDKNWFMALGRFKQLRQLDLGDLVWDAEMTELTPEVLPEVEELWVGALHHEYSAPKGEALRNLTKSLATIPRLRHLHLPWTPDLNVGFDGWPLYGNFYDGEEGARYWRQDQLRYLEAAETAGDIVRGDLPTLKGIDIGIFYGNFTLDANGNNITIWPWTGNLEDWLLKNLWSV